MATLDLGRVIPLERGTWAANTDYVFMDSVQYEGSTYVCIADHTSASGNRPTTSSGQANYWRRNSRGFEPKGAWNANITYDRDNLVDYGGSVYRCIANTTAGIDPTNGTYWESFAQGIGEYLGEWNSNDAYAEGSIVIWDIDSANNINGTFRANQDVPTNYNPGDYPAYWDVLAAGFVWMGTWNNSVTYRWRSVVTHHGYLYIAPNKGGAPAGEDPTALTNWVKMTEGQNFVGSLESLGSGTSLFVGDVVTFANGTYQVIGNTNGADDPRQTPSNFRSLAKFWDWQGTWNNSTVYYLDQVVLYQNSIYRVLNTTTTGQNPDNASSLFQTIIEAPENFSDYNSATKRLQIRRVDSSTNSSTAYANAEPVAIVDGSGNATGELRIHDGSTNGGQELVLGSGVDFSGIANDSISGDKINGGTATPATLSGSILNSTKLASSGTSVYKSNGSTAVISESSGTVTLQNVKLSSSNVILPQWTVVQQRVHLVTTQFSFSLNTTFTEIGGSYLRIPSFTPKHQGSTLLIQWDVNFNNNSLPGYIKQFRAYNYTSGSNLSIGTSNGQRQQCTLSRRFNANDSNSLDQLQVNAIDVNVSTTARVYTLYGRIEGSSGTHQVNHTNNNNSAYGSTMVSTFSITELIASS